MRLSVKTLKSHAASDILSSRVRVMDDRQTTHYDNNRRLYFAMQLQRSATKAPKTFQRAILQQIYM